MGRYWVGGATGFLGSHLVRTLSGRGHEVVAVARSGGEVHGIHVTPVDVLDADAVFETAGGCEGAFLAFGKVSRDRADAEELHRLHVHGTRYALEGLERAGVRRAVYASTSGTMAVSEAPSPVPNESASAPMEILQRFPYYRSKYYGELEALERNESGKIEVVVVNPSLLLGPGDVRGSSTEDVRKFLDRSIPATPSGGVSFVDVRDAAEAMANALSRGRAGERYLLGAANLTVAAFFAKLERLSGVAAPELVLPRSRVVAILGTRLFSRAVRAIGGEPLVDEVSVEMGQHFWYCDSSKAEREIGFSPRDPMETLRDTIDYIRGRVRRRVERPAAE